MNTAATRRRYRWAALLMATLALVHPPATCRAVPLCPQPQDLKLLPDQQPLDLSNGYRLNVISPDAAPLAHAAEQLRAAVTKAFGVISSDDAAATITVGVLGDMPIGSAGLEAAEALPAEGYILTVTGDGASVLGKDARGAAYGCQTLIQLLRAGKPVPAMLITDWPDTAYRMAHIGGGSTLTASIRHTIDIAAHYKLNMLVIDAGAYFQLEDQKIAAGIKEVFDYCRTVGIEPIPELQSFGWAGHILSWEPLCAEAHPWKNRQYVFGADDLAVFLPAPGMSLNVSNADFENGDGDRFAGWEQDDVGQTVFADRGADGSRALRITRTTPGWSRAWQTFDCIPNQRYTLQVDVKVEPGEDFYAYYEVYYGTTGVYLHCGSIGDGKEADWHTRTIVLEPGPSTSMTIYLRLQSGTGTVWFDNIVCRRVQSSPLVNVMRTDGLPFEVKSPDGMTLYTEDMDYQLLPGDKLAYPFEETVKPWRIRRLPAGRIKSGATVSVSYHNAQRGATGTYCPSEPRTQAIMKRAIQQTVKFLKPRFVHIGHDETRLINRDDRCRRRGLKAYELFADDVRRLRGYAREVDPNVRLMMWADALDVTDGTLHNVEPGMIDVAHRFNDRCTIEQMAKLIPTDVIMNCWKYNTSVTASSIETKINKLYEFMVTRVDAGYEATGSPWFGLVNIYCWAKALQRLRLESDRPLGLYLTTWSHHWETLPLASNLMWTLDTPSYQGVEDPAEVDRRLRQWNAQFPTDGSVP